MNSTWYVRISIAFLLLLLPNALNAQRDSSATFYLGGIQVGEYDQTNWTNALKNSGMNTVEVTVYARQGNWDSDELWFEDEDLGALNQIRAAREANLNVVLVLRVALDHAFERNKFLWHGMILPKSKRSLKSWFDKYSKFVLKWSRIAEEEGVEVVAIGSELNALVSTIPLSEQSLHYQFMLSDSAQRVMENRALKYKNQIGKDIWIQGYQHYDSLELLIDERIAANVDWAKQITFDGTPDALQKMNQRREFCRKQWNKLIRKTKRQFSGQVTYAANFDSYFEVNFWDQLDFIGINAYFPLRESTIDSLNFDSLSNVLEQGWESVFDAIESFQVKHGLEKSPVLFTELGYTKYADATVEPWTGFGYSVVGEDENEKLIIWNQQKINLEERSLAIQKLWEVTENRSCKLQGVLYWKFTSMPSQIPIEPFAILLNTNEGSNDPALEALKRFAP